MAELKLFHKILIFIAVVFSLVELAKLSGKLFDKKKSQTKIPPMKDYDSVPEAMVRKYGYGFRDDGTPQKAPVSGLPLYNKQFTTKPVSPIVEKPTTYPVSKPVQYNPVTISIPDPEPNREIFYIRGLD